MRIPRVYHPEPLKDCEQARLTPAGSRHVLTVLRLKSGAPLVLFDGSGFEFEALLEKADRRQALVKISRMHGPVVESPLRITLVQGISRGERMDYTVQKSVELGVSAILPVVTQRSVVRLDEKAALRKQQHWQQIAVSACEQSGRVRIPEIPLPVTLAQCLAAREQSRLKLLLDPRAVDTVGGLSETAQHGVQLLVGPEGGLADDELDAARGAGYLGVQLGPRVLRTETAALAALSLLQAKWGDLGGL
ncbi:MAG: 16S rRNA (uracil(1498)-N(3))-methyltransferase [Gammaproteobacteria bacterium]|nr:16S rRNA (uracil(1498)-N(3))-methyltransferase [Gammaproteobacteria bacterium]MDE2346264.1 16S rRNA (uracil(1498)-N(3))-methyltransferase [Gammaproteobacteria bacterium]